VLGTSPRCSAVQSAGLCGCDQELLGMHQGW
jgi:hypothetical protein